MAFSCARAHSPPGKRSGLLALLDEEARLPRGESKNFFAKLVKEHAKKKKDPDYDKSRLKWTTGSPVFTLVHYAGEVRQRGGGDCWCRLVDPSSIIFDRLRSSSISLIRVDHYRRCNTTLSSSFRRTKTRSRRT